MPDLTQSEINDLLAKQLTQQWLGQRRLIDQHTQAPNKDQLSKGLRILQQAGRLGTVETDGNLYYYLRSEFQAACALALPVLYKKALKHVGKVLTMGDVMGLARKYEDEISRLLGSRTHRAHAFPALLDLVRDGVEFQLVELPGPERVCQLVRQVEIPLDRQETLAIQETAAKSWVTTRENGWNAPLVGKAVACA